jgi:hypothetical protein
MTLRWFFDREGESLRFEARFNDRCEFVAAISQPDGGERTERFSTFDHFEKWLVAFELVLRERDWVRRTGGPIVLPYDWHPNVCGEVKRGRHPRTCC